MLACAERERDNPFDKGSGTHSPLRLELFPRGKSVEVKVSLIDPIQVAGFRIYRAKDDSTHFQKIADLSRGEFSFLDTSIVLHHWYFYYGTALGQGVESPPSPLVKTYTGPGLNWILTRYNYSINQYSYDLMHEIRGFTTNYPAINWSVDLKNRKIWLANAQFANVSRFDLISGYEDLIIGENLQYPIDVVWDSLDNKAWVLDDEKNTLNMVSELGVEKVYSLPEDSYLKLSLLPGFGLAVLGETHLHFVLFKSDSVRSLTFDPDFSGYDLRHKGEYLYTLSGNPGEKTSEIWVFSLPELAAAKYQINGFFTIIRETAKPNIFWMAEKISNEKSQVVKLSLDGTRLFQLSSTGLVTDLAINPYDSSLVILKRYENQVTILLKDGKEISSLSIYDPIRVFIE